MRFKLRRPCKNCPFRKDVVPFLGGRRAEQMAQEVVMEERTFTCHETIDYDKWDEETNPEGWQDIRKNNHCVGAIQLIESVGRPHQMLQVAERLGLYDPKNIDRSTPCFKSVKEFTKHHGRG